ncbi:YtxH domain-containing protein [Flavicella sp.]|uniref:YtxH domain-containing protein n=1 Tax=Flavicella sp. TaxID=2957742 RepID=UPI00301A989F
MSNTSKWVTGLVIGLFVGAITGVLLAPSSGKETRESLLNKIDLLKEKMSDLIERGGEYTSEKVDLIKAKIAALEKKLTKKETV